MPLQSFSPPRAETPASVVVTGASGFIGTRLVSKLRERGMRVIALDLLEPRERLDGVDYRKLDIREALPAELGAGVQRIYNLAAVHRTPGHLDHEYYETNVLGATNVAAFADACGIGTIVFTSSISVYGASEHLMIETSEVRPTSAYGRSKLLAERIHTRWCERDATRRLVIVRPGVVFGPGERGNFTYLARALRRGMFFYPGRKTTVKSCGYIDELLAALDFALEQSDRQVLFNFAYPEQSTTEDIVEAFNQVGGFGRKPATVPVAPLYAVASLFEAANLLGLTNRVHRERVLKLVHSTKVEPGWLKARGYAFNTDMRQALAAWGAETHGEFV